jgi:hypothetical protein
VKVDVPSGAVSSGQPPADAGFGGAGEAALQKFVRTSAPYDTTIILSGSCAMHLRFALVDGAA